MALILIKNEKRNFAWGNAQKMMMNPAKFKQEVSDFRGEEIEEWKLAKVAPFIAKETFVYEKMTSVSMAAANLCNWACNIITFNTIYKKVKPLMDKAAEAEEEVKQA